VSVLAPRAAGGEGECGCHRSQHRRGAPGPPGPAQLPHVTNHPDLLAALPAGVPASCRHCSASNQQPHGIRLVPAADHPARARSSRSLVGGVRAGGTRRTLEPNDPRDARHATDPPMRRGRTTSWARRARVGRVAPTRPDPRCWRRGCGVRSAAASPPRRCTVHRTPACSAG
jgi:hypothetical protein